MEALDKQFGVTEAGTTVNAEMRAGLTTFLTMAYILLVNPAMLSIAGIPFDDALFATAIAAFVGCTIMGLYANLPFALAPGMGLNAYFTFAVVLGMGISWQVALAAVFVEGILFLLMSMPAIPVIGGWRTIMINSIPTDLKIATGAGIGMFLAIIGLREMGWIRDDGATLVNLGVTESFTYEHGALISMVCLIAIAVMMARGIKGAIIIGIGIASVWGWAVGAYDPYNDYMAGGAGFGSAYAEWPSAAFGFVGLPEESLMAATGALGDISGGAGWGDFLLVMITFLFVDIFDTAGTLYSVGRQAGYVDENDELMNSDEAFVSDAAASIVGALCGTSTTTTYIESAAGVEEGGKTGLVAVTVGVLMLTGLFFSDLFQAVPTFAAACALVIIGALMMRQAADINWADKEMALPAFLTICLMPFTYSIADGIAWGIISYVAIKLGMGKMDELNPVMWTLFALMAMFYLGPGDESTFQYIFGMIF
ncbi:NCS2 family permease [Candidatus Thalassarchaeum betae]|uniref:NCS2 family permease n=1 Tax=Candidatus Thalassarchaeum betae TaxID=2599289 RepID=UPI0030C6E5AF|nr:NCS2 family permease [Candidatus Thalassoarchaea betae]